MRLHLFILVFDCNENYQKQPLRHTLCLLLAKKKRLIPGHQLHAIYFDIRFQEQADDEKDLDKTFSLNQAEYVTRAGVKTK